MDTSDKARGERFKQIRLARGETQVAFAARLTAAAKELRLSTTYDDGDVSARETGRRSIDIEDYTLASYLDPQQRSWFWLAFGRETPKAMLIARPKGGGANAANGSSI